MFNYSKTMFSIIKKVGISILLILGIGIISGVFANGNVESRVNSIVSVIQSNTTSMSPSDKVSYYQLVRLNIKSLLEVLEEVDQLLSWEENTWIIKIDTTISDCRFNLKPYFNQWYKTTFYPANNRIYEPNALGEMTLPGDMKSDFYIWKDQSTDPHFYFKCSNGKLSVYNKNLQIIDPLPGVINSTWSIVNSYDKPNQISPEQQLFQEKFELCFNEYKIASCQEFMGTSPQAFSKYSSPNNTWCNNDSKADSDGWTMNYFEEQITNTDIVLNGWWCSVMRQTGYCRKGTTIEVSPDVIRQEIWITWWIGSEGWSPSRNSWYTNKFTAAPSTDACYSKVNGKMYHKEYFSKAFEPFIEINRLNTESWQYMEWKTKSVDRLSWECKNISTWQQQSNQNELLNHEKYYFTWNELHKNNWSTGLYECRWKLEWYGKIKYHQESFNIK